MALSDQDREALKRWIVEAFVGRKAEGLLYSDDYNTSAFDEEFDKVLEKLGIVSVKQGLGDLLQDVAKYLGLSPEEYYDLTLTEETLEFDAEWVFRLWAEEADDRLEIKYERNYNNKGMAQRVTNRLVNGRKLPLFVSFLCSFDHEPYTVSFVRNDQFCFWQISARGKNGDQLLVELKKKLNEHFVKTYKGKSLNHKLCEIDLKEYDRDQLIYPKRLGRQIDDLLASFMNWHGSSKVDRWGSIFLGGPGTGKTTVGGILAKIRPEGCTFLYCPSGEVRTAEEVNKIFRLANLLAPTILQIDDIDLISPDRRTGNASLTSSLMENLDGLKKGSKLFVIMTSNHPKGMEQAIIDRAGRVSGKIFFKGYGECLPQFIALGADKYSLSFRKGAIDTALNSLSDQMKELTPDEAMNVCQRLHLLYGQRKITSTELVRAIEETHEAFRNRRNNDTFLRVDSPEDDDGEEDE